MVFVIIPYNSFAVDACVQNDTVAVILDNSVGNGSSYDYTGSSPKVTVNMPYGTLYGIAACLSSNFGKIKKVNGNDPNWVYTDNGGVLIDNGNIVVGGEENGSYCWCRITYPVVSNWMLIAEPGWYQQTNSPCAWSCKADCGWHISNYSVKRGAAFNLLQN